MKYRVLARMVSITDSKFMLEEAHTPMEKQRRSYNLLEWPRSLDGLHIPSDKRMCAIEERIPTAHGTFGLPVAFLITWKPKCLRAHELFECC